MNTVSTFQLIPPDVVRTILEYVAKLDGFRTRLRAHLPLLWVSRNFRDVTYSYYCSLCCVDIKITGATCTPTWPLWPKHLQKLDRPLSHASKGLKIVAGLPSVYSGDALESLVSTLTDVQSLSLIRKVYLELDIMSNEPAYKGETSTIETHIRAFVKQLKRLAPSVVSVDVLTCDSLQGRHKRETGLHFGYLLSRLFRLCRRVKFSCIKTAKRASNQELNINRNLTHIDFRMNYGRPAMLQMIRQNAPTLISLLLDLPKNADLSGLFRSSGSSYVVYPKLHSLKFTAWEDRFIDTTQLKFPGAVPFPGLRRLTMECYYMFIDDVVLKGNAATLEYLQILLTKMSFEILQSRNVFTPVSHPKLRHVD
ncbi:hypothetical protein GGI21_002255, partial [Coemansia aciculifera]